MQATRISAYDDWMERLSDPIFGPFKRRPIAVFVGLAFGISWVTFALRPILLGPDGSSAVLSWILKFGPSLAGVIAAAWFGGTAGLVTLARGLLRWRVPLRFYAIALLGPTAVFGGVVALEVARRSGVEIALDVPEALRELGRLMAIRFFAGGGLGEELGWRGFLLPQLQPLLGAMPASLWIGVEHGLWHLPSGPVGAILLTALTTGGAILMTAIYNRTGSLFICALLHASANAQTAFVGVLMPELKGAFLWQLAGLMVAAAAAAWGGLRMGIEPEVT